MFDSIISKLTHLLLNVVRAIGAATQRTPWLAPVAIIAVILVL